MTPLFFLPNAGRYLPQLTEVEIEFAALEQRLQIEEELLKLRLKRGCFLALAERAPQAVILSPERRDGVGLVPGETQSIEAVRCPDACSEKSARKAGLTTLPFAPDSTTKGQR